MENNEGNPKMYISSLYIGSEREESDTKLDSEGHRRGKKMKVVNDENGK